MFYLCWLGTTCIATCTYPVWNKTRWMGLQMPSFHGSFTEWHWWHCWQFFFPASDAFLRRIIGMLKASEFQFVSQRCSECHLVILQCAFLASEPFDPIFLHVFFLSGGFLEHDPVATWCCAGCLYLLHGGACPILQFLGANLGEVNQKNMSNSVKAQELLGDLSKPRNLSARKTSQILCKT